MIKVLSVFGTRPEAVPANCAGLRKLAPVSRELRRHTERAMCKVCVTAQHRQMWFGRRVLSAVERLTTDWTRYCGFLTFCLIAILILCDIQQMGVEVSRRPG
jgi:hypothetical protein